MPHRLGLLFAAILISFSVPSSAYAADLDAVSSGYRPHKKLVRVAYRDCRTGWWAAHCSGMPRPIWLTRCR